MPTPAVADLPLFTQPLDDGPDLVGLAPRVVRLWRAFLEEREAPDILAAFEQMAINEANRGRHVFVDQLIWEVRRVHGHFDNNLRSAVARWLIWRHPGLRERFTLRKVG